MILTKQYIQMMDIKFINFHIIFPFFINLYVTVTADMWASSQGIKLKCDIVSDYLCVERYKSVTFLYYTLAAPNIYLISCIAKWVGPTDNIWISDQCQFIDQIKFPNVDQCKTSCSEREGCTAINYMAIDNDCILRKCYQPVPLPITAVRNWNGFYVISGINIEC